MGMRVEKQLTIHEKVGMLFSMGAPSNVVDHQFHQRFAALPFGGMSIYPYNIESKEQLLSLFQDVQEFNEKKGYESPFLMALDEEGGTLSTLDRFFPSVPGNRALGLKHNPQLAYDNGKLLGSMMATYGVAVDWAPILDVNTNRKNSVIGVRSYGEDPTLVSDYGAKYIQGLHDAGVAATAKHFPGHGETEADSHLGSVTCSLSESEIFEKLIPPFERAIREGVDAIMVNHVIYDQVAQSNGLPATMSHYWMTEILRGKLGFNGVICTDDMEMRAIKDHFPAKEIGVLAVEAGVDQLLICHSPELQQEVFDGLVAAVETGRISESRIDESIERLVQLKKAVTLYRSNATVIPERQWAQHALQLAKQCLHVERDPKQLLPLDQTKSYALILPKLEALTPADSTDGKEVPLASKLVNLQVDTFSISLKPTQEEITELRQQVDDKDVVIIGTINAHLFTEQQALVRRLNDKDCIVLVLRDPYDCDVIPAEQTVLLICSTGESSMEAFALEYS
ncbi:beta-N-acetylhexosaminidase [Shouchella sp. JSM 1781072]|uniref:beta-N-acetylhexosaminidase n=1 Tax=Bacillaceae TaxID=186817 RepID=UPI0020D09ABF|nr:beta-N-acetylhexosaminidase [Alkalihalobacillus sp. LMS6]UTR08143.1 beta-N-acetylhexosaminidase [Alkalihalobacillus sp. LMS6]